MIPNFEVTIIEGNEDYEELARLTAWAYRMLLNFDPELHDGLGNCLCVAALAHGVARALDLKPKLYGGQVFDGSRPCYSVGGHYWVEVARGVIVDSPRPNLLMIGTAAQRAHRYVPLGNARGSNASMRKARKLRGLSDSTCKRMRTNPPPGGWPPA
jgi:hypothetical protein